MDGDQLLGLSAVITAVMTPLVIIFTTVWTNRKVDAVQVIAANVETQVTTMNTKSMANITDDNETRRIGDIPPEERSEVETAHMATAKIEGEQSKAKTEEKNQ